MTVIEKGDVANENVAKHHVRPVVQWRILDNFERHKQVGRCPSSFMFKADAAHGGRQRVPGHIFRSKSNSCLHVDRSRISMIGFMSHKTGEHGGASMLYNFPSRTEINSPVVYKMYWHDLVPCRQYHRTAYGWLYATRRHESVHDKLSMMGSATQVSLLWIVYQTLNIIWYYARPWTYHLPANV